MAGRLSDKKGPFPVAITITLSLAIGYFLMARVQTLVGFYFYHGLLLPIGIGAGFPGLLPQVSHFFTKNRGLMIGIASSGVGASSFIIAPVTRNFINLIGWRQTYFLWGLILLVILGIASFVFKNIAKHRPPPPPKVEAGASALGMTFGEALKSPDFYFLSIGFFLFGYNLHSIMIHIIPFALDMDLEKYAVGILVFIGGISITTRIGAAWLSDHIGPKNTLLIEMSLMLAAFIVIKFTITATSLFLFGGLFGLAYGGGLAVVAVGVTDYFGQRSSGTILGSITSFYTVGGALGPLFTGIIFDFRGNYDLAFTICLIFAVINLVLYSRLSKPRFRTFN